MVRSAGTKLLHETVGKALTWMIILNPEDDPPLVVDGNVFLATKRYGIAQQRREVGHPDAPEHVTLVIDKILHKLQANLTKDFLVDVGTTKLNLLEEGKSALRRFMSGKWALRLLKSEGRFFKHYARNGLVRTSKTWQYTWRQVVKAHKKLASQAGCWPRSTKSTRKAGRDARAERLNQTYSTSCGLRDGRNLLRPSPSLSLLPEQRMKEELGISLCP